jgi:hypothetical protein
MTGDNGEAEAGGQPPLPVFPRLLNQKAFETQGAFETWKAFEIWEPFGKSF